MKLSNREDKRVLKERIANSKIKRVTMSFYQYAQIGNPHFFRDYLYLHFDEVGVLGRIYVASEGINAQLSVPEKNLNAFEDVLNNITFLRGIRLNTAFENKDDSFYMRNHYETEVGYFKGAITPDVDNFRESLPFIEDKFLKGNEDKNIVMYCTGGIRCEKASAWYKHRGFKNVYQLEGGIIKYAHDISKEGVPNMFVGKNFVFDDRLEETISPTLDLR